MLHYQAGIHYKTLIILRIIFIGGFPLASFESFSQLSRAGMTKLSVILLLHS